MSNETKKPLAGAMKAARWLERERPEPCKVARPGVSCDACIGISDLIVREIREGE